MKIKMRTWIDGQFYYWGHLEFDTFTGPVHSTGESLSMEEAMERTQMSIGLLDKSGKEIYGGDKIQGHGEWGSTSGSEVVFSFKGAEVEIGDHWINLSRFTDIEIIGNIYENPELPERIADA